MAGNSTDPGRSVTSKVTAILMAFADGGARTLTEIAGVVEAAGLRQAAVIMVGPAIGRRVPPEEQVESHLYSSIRDRCLESPTPVVRPAPQG